MVAEQPIEDWAQVPWRTLEAAVYRLQKRIYRASGRGNSAAVHTLQLVWTAVHGPEPDRDRPQ